MTTKIAGREVEELKYPGMEDPDTAFTPPTLSTPQATAPKTTAKSQAKAEESPNPFPRDVGREVTPLPDSVKAAPILSKFREMFGLKRTKPKYKTVSIYDPDTDSKYKMTLGFRPLGVEEFSWVVTKSAAYPVVDEFHAMHNRNWKVPVLAIGLTTMDEGELAEGEQGTPLWKQLGLTPNPSEILDPYNPSIVIRLQCAEVMEEVMRDSFYTVLEDLFDFYEKEIEKTYRAIKEATSNVGPLASTGSENSTTNSGSEQS